MMNSVLGTHMIVFEGDGSKLDRAMKTSEMTAKRAAESINKAIRENVASGMAKASDAAKAAAPKLLAPYKDLSPILRVANQEAVKLSERIKTGAVIGTRDVQKLTAAEDRLRQQIIATFGAVEKATAGATAGYNRVRRAMELAVAESRRQKIVLEDQRNATTAAGFKYASLSDALQDVARGYGSSGASAAAFIAKAAGASFIIREATGLVKGLVAVGVGEQGLQLYESAFDRIAKKGRNVTNTFYEMTAAALGFAAARAAADVKPEDLSNIPSNAPRFKTGGLSPEDADRLKGLQREDVEKTQRQTVEQIALKSLQLEEAQLNGNAVAARRLTRELAELRATEALMSGATLEHAEAVKGLTLRLNDAAAAQAARRMETERARRQAQADTELAQLSSDLDRFLEDIQNRNREAEAAASQAAAGATNVAQLNAFLANAGAIRAAQLVAVSQQETMWDRLAAKYIENAATLESVMGQAVGHVEGLFSDVLFAGITGNLDDMVDSFRGFFKNLAREIANFMAQQAVKQMLLAFAGRYGTGGTNAGDGWITALANMAGGFVKRGNGGYLAGGFQAFASGGIVSKPTLGLVGEGRYNEAVVPLPDGKSIPVVGVGGAQQRQPINVEVVWHPEFVQGIVNAAAAKGAAQASRMVIPIVADDLRYNGAIRKLMQASV
jgi:hypothetical protein